MKTPRRVTAAQVKELRRQLNQGASLRTAAMKANMDRKSARKYRKLNQLPEEARQAHTWRTRPDPLVEVWPAVAEQLQTEPRLQAKTLWEWLQRAQPGKCPESVRRTFERRVRQWKSQHGPAKEVYFTQVHVPGRLGASDFTSMNDLQVTIAGVPFPHLVYHFVLPYSNWEHVTLCLREDFASLSMGLQNAVWALGAVPARHRTDRMTLAVNHDGQAEQFTDKYRALLGHYGMQGEATNPASGHENGDVESSHRHFKEAVEQALLLRGSRDFASREAYWQWVQSVLAQRNAGRTAKVADEMSCLRPLPAGRLETLERARVRVRRTSTIRVKKNAYSIPSRLIGEEVEVRIGMEEIEVWYAQQLVQRLPRLRGQDKHRIDYRHIIDWLVRKPGAFARYVYREELYPTLTFRRSYDALVAQQPERADREYVRILYLAAQEGEARVEEALAKLLEQQRPLSEQGVRLLLGSKTPLSVAAQVSVPAVDLRMYDALLEGASCQGYDIGMSQPERSMEVIDEQGRDGGVDALPATTASGDDAEPVRGGGPSSDRGIVELCGLSAGVGRARMPAAAPQPDRAARQSIAAGAGEDLGNAGSQASAHQGDPAIAEPAQRGFSGPARECSGVWPTGFREDACPQCSGPRAGASGATGAPHQVQPARSGTLEGEARSGSEGVAPGAVTLGGSRDRRPGLRAAEPRGDGGAVHLAGGALRARQCVGDEQPGLLAMGANLQGSDDDSGGHRPPGASQRHRGDERAELSRRVGEADAGNVIAQGGVRGGERRPGWGSGFATVAVAALRRPPLRQTPTPAGFDSGAWGILIVANGES
jgi:hypothetical protein